MAMGSSKTVWAAWAWPLLLLPPLSVVSAAYFDTGLEENGSLPALILSCRFLLIHGSCFLVWLATRRFNGFRSSLLFALSCGIWQAVCLLMYWSATPEPCCGTMGQGIALMLNRFGSLLLAILYLTTLLLGNIARKKGTMAAVKAVAVWLTGVVLLIVLNYVWLMGLF